MNPYGLIIPASIALMLIIIAYSKGGIKNVGAGFSESGNLILYVLPNLLIGFTLAGFLTLILPQELVAKWLGADAGFKGIAVGSLAGALTPGGPFTHFPILASLIGKGAAIGPVSAYISAWAMIGIHRIIIWEIPILGWRFVCVRVLSSIIFPLIIGAIAQRLADIFKV